jgi:hypothetical protein
MSRPVSLLVPTSVVPGSVMPPPRDRPGSPGCRTPIRTSKALGSMPRPSSRPLSCLAASGVPQSTETAGSPGGSALPSGGDGSPAFRTPCSVAWCGLLQPSTGQQNPLPATSNPRSRDAAGRAGTVASHGPCPTSPGVSYPGRSGSRLGRAPSCSQTPDTAAVSHTPVLVRRPWRVSHRQSPKLLWQPSWLLCPSSSRSESWSPFNSADFRPAVAQQTPPRTSQPQLPSTSAV